MMYSRWILALILVSCEAVIGYEAPLHGQSMPNAVPDRFLVTLQDDCTFEQHFKRIGVSTKDRYFNDIQDIRPFVNGYGVQLPPPELEKVRSDECVRAVTHDIKAFTDFTPKYSRKPVDKARSGPSNSTQRAKRQLPDWLKTKQSNAPWGLATISEPSKPEPVNTERTTGDYYYEDSAGWGVDIYIVDSAFSLLNPEFGGRASLLWTGDSTDYSRGDHGSCIASIAAGTSFGVAKHANVISAPRPETPTALAWFNSVRYILGAHKSKVAEGTAGFEGSIIVLCYSVLMTEVDSWPAEFRDFVYGAMSVFKELDELGILVVAPGGNDDLALGNREDMYGFPCQFPGVVCVGGIAKDYGPLINTDGRPETVHGSGVSIWAPGLEVRCSDGRFGDPEEFTPTGTSVAAPHVAGAAALFLSYESERDDQVKYDTVPVRKFLFGNAKRDWLDLSRLSPQTRNLLLNTGITTVRPPGDEKPFIDPYNPLTLRGIVDWEDQIPNHVVIAASAPAVSKAACSGDVQRTLEMTTWEYAETLRFRLQLEYGHVNLYDPDRVHALLHTERPGHRHGWDQPVPCYKTACIYLFWPEGATIRKAFIQDAGMLEPTVDHIMRHCMRPLTNENGQNVVDENGKQVYMTGGQMEIRGTGGLYISIEKGF